MFGITTQVFISIYLNSMWLCFLHIIPNTNQSYILIRRFLPTRRPHKIIVMFPPLWSHNIIPCILAIHAIPNLFFNFSRERRVPPADKLSAVQLLFIFNPEIAVLRFFLWDRGVNVILVQEFFLVFLHELSGGVAFELPHVVGVGLSEASDFLVAFLGAWWDISIGFYGEIIARKLSFRVQPQRKIILCRILWTLYHLFNLLCF